MKLLVVDDDPDLSALVAFALTNAGYAVVKAADTDEAIAVFEAEVPNLVILDINLPSGSGFDVCKEIRASGSAVPIIMLTARGQEIDKVLGLKLGADDYVTKPFDLRELLARIKALLRRLPPEAPPPPAPAQPEPTVRTTLRFAGWSLDTAARTLLSPERRDVPLTTGEFDLLGTFARHPGRVLSRDFLLEATRGRESGPFDRTIDVQVGRLRRKIEADPEHPQIIKSVRGAGYLFVPPVAVS